MFRNSLAYLTGASDLLLDFGASDPIGGSADPIGGSGTVTIIIMLNCSRAGARKSSKFRYGDPTPLVRAFCLNTLRLSSLGIMRKTLFKKFRKTLFRKFFCSYTPKYEGWREDFWIFGSKVP